MASTQKACALYSIIIVEIFHIFVSSLLVEQQYIKQNFDGTNITSEIVSKTSGSIISCGVYCNGVGSCVAFLFSYTLQTCLLLDKLVTTESNSPSDGNWLYFVKSNDCPVSWKMNGENNYCFVNNSLQWKPAKESCISMGSHLLELETEVEQTWIQNKVSGYSWWIGGTDAKSEGTFYWEHSNNAMKFTNWNGNQPNGAEKENCMTMHTNGLWHDYPCNTTFYYICEK